MPEMKIWMALRNVLLREVSLIAPVEGVTSPSPSGTFITVFDTPAPPTKMFIKSQKPHLRSGILTLVYVAPIGHAREVYKNKAIEIAKSFHDGRKLGYQDVCVEISGAPHIQEGYRDEGDWRTPLTINWRAFA